MKKKFSNSWDGSSQIRKQRKFRANAPLHIKSKMISAHLSKELRKKYGKRSFSLRKGDEVKIMKGAFKKKTGKISMVNTKKMKVAIEEIQRKKKDGTKINILFDASNLQIQSLNLDDKKRNNALSRKGAGKEKKSGSYEKKEKSNLNKTKSVLVEEK